MRKILAAIALLSATACASGSATAPGAGTQASRPAPSGAAVRAPGGMRGADINGIIGARAADLTNRFGIARIDMVEGDARKLQYASDTCVLDIYLYPAGTSGEPIAAHVETRQREGGAEANRAGCIGEVERAATRR